jgi:hypothetical protein
MLGNASLEDRKPIPGILNEVFGLQTSDDENLTVGGRLF